MHENWVLIIGNSLIFVGERGGSVVECRTPEREVRGSRPTAAVLCPWARHFTPRKYWLITQEAMAPSRHDWKIVDWDVKPQHNQPTNLIFVIGCVKMQQALIYCSAIFLSYHKRFWSAPILELHFPVWIFTINTLQINNWIDCQPLFLACIIAQFPSACALVRPKI